ncbi:MAG: hypothetical protein ABIQ16_24925 [Polyangiaceae bacterium]
MRALAACFAVFVGLGAMTALATTMAGCSSTSDAGSGGASGAAANALAGAGGANAGAGAGGAACSFSSDACSGCFVDKCKDLVAACSADTNCAKALPKLTPCVCGGTDVETCAGSFYTDGGDPAQKLAECYSLNCTAACE